MGLTNLLIKKRDVREKEIEILLKKTLEAWPMGSFDGRVYLHQATKLKRDIEKEKGQIYFEKYPKILNKIDAVIKELIEYES